MKKTNKKEYLKIIIIGFLLIICLFLTYYFHFILKSEIVFTHFFYAPIILASFWWLKRGILYDPEVVDICPKLFKEKSFNFEKT
ncbi:unnamed protein product [marine sediment metagenome]|uniref:Uncharacterized protein n=1 Tax=marine sediment metagenome TaxID=412755 RepID=X1VDE5_9ZZZZ